ncbi:hypothetical protein BDQ17DRAFT_285987 [Cyathus striatus]|nr:hypothetical protein BDQ17DRAFT_285987 [Cyathus striatus]
MNALSTTRLCLKGIPRDVDEEALRKFVSCYGRVLEVKFVYNNSFIEFVNEKDAKCFYDTFKDKSFLGSDDVVVEFAHMLRKYALPSLDSKNTIQELEYKRELTPIERLEECVIRRHHYENGNLRNSIHTRYRVNVKNLARTVAWQELKDFARLAGRQAAYCHVNSDTGDGFIEYDTRDDAEHAVRKLAGRWLEGKETLQHS